MSRLFLQQLRRYFQRRISIESSSLRLLQHPHEETPRQVTFQSMAFQPITD